MNEQEFYNQQAMQQQGRQFYPDQQTSPISEAKPDFTKWLFSFKEQVTSPLKHEWRGEELKNGVYQQTGEALMNEKGITWCISLINKYLNASTIVTNLTKDDINFMMREIWSIIIGVLVEEYKFFGIAKYNISRIAVEIEHTIFCILKGAENNGYRIFFTKTYNVSEIKQTALSDNRMSSGGMFRSGLFGDKNQGMM